MVAALAQEMHFFFLSIRCRKNPFRRHCLGLNHNEKKDDNYLYRTFYFQKRFHFCRPYLASAFWPTGFRDERARELDRRLGERRKGGWHMHKAASPTVHLRATAEKRERERERGKKKDCRHRIRDRKSWCRHPYVAEKNREVATTHQNPKGQRGRRSRARHGADDKSTDCL